MYNSQMAQTARHHMIDGQLLPNRVVRPEIIAAMGVTPRERFVPEAYSQCAYVDEDIPLGAGRYLMEPVTLALLIQALNVEAGNKVLVVGGNTGYSSAILAQLGADVVMIEDQSDLVEYSRSVMKEMGYASVKVYQSPLAKGYNGCAPYHAILIDGAVETVPAAVLDQLDAGGRLATVENNRKGSSLVGGVGQAVLWHKLDNGGFGRDVLQDTSVPVIPSLKTATKFVL